MWFQHNSMHTTLIRVNLLRYREFSKVMSDHLRLDLHLIELLARVDTNHTSNHLWNHNHVPEMSLDEVGLFVRLGLLLGFAQFLDQSHRLPLEATVEPTTSTGMDEIPKFFGCKVEQSNMPSILRPLLRTYCHMLGTYWSRSTPRYENFRNALFFFNSVFDRCVSLRLSCGASYNPLNTRLSPRQLSGIMKGFHLGELDIGLKMHTSSLLGILVQGSCQLGIFDQVRQGKSEESTVDYSRSSRPP